MKYDSFSGFHPLTNFIFFLGAICFSVVILHPFYILAGCISAAAYYLVLKGIRGIKLLLGLVPLFVFLSAINPLLNTDGETVLFLLFGRPYTLEALYYGMAVAGMFVQMLLWFGCYSQVMTSDKFVSLFGRLIPALSLLLVMVLRMIPNLMRKARQLLGARSAIGKGAVKADPLRKKLNGGMTVLSALTDWALEGSVVTADSMRARGYGAAKRTGFQIYRFSLQDGILLGVMAALAAAVLTGGSFAAVYTPRLSAVTPGWGLGAYGIFLLLPTALQLQESLRWRIAMAGTTDFAGLPEKLLYAGQEKEADR